MRSSLLLSLFLVGTAALAAEPGAAALQKIEVQSIEIAEISSDRVRLRVRLDGVAQQDVSIRSLAIDDAFINGVPVFSPAKAGPIRIPKGTRFSTIEPLEASFFYRDLSSLEPIRRIVREEKAFVRATIRLQPEFSLLQRIVLRTATAWVSWRVEKEIRVYVPGGFTGKTAAELTLAAADAVWVVSQKGIQWRRERDAFNRQVREDYGARVLPAKTECMITHKDGRKALVLWEGLAFHTGDGRVMAPAEAVEPWLFDPGVAEMLAGGGFDLVRESLDVKVGPYSLRSGTLSIESIGSDKSKGFSVERRRTFALRDRSSSFNFAFLRIPELKGAPVKISANGGDVVVFRRREDGSTELLPSVATAQNGRSYLMEPIDSRAYGSPVVAKDGVLGILVSQTSIQPVDAR